MTVRDIAGLRREVDQQTRLPQEVLGSMAHRLATQNAADQVAGRLYLRANSGRLDGMTPGI